MGLFGNVLHSQESQVFIYMLSLSLAGKITGENVSLDTEMCPIEEEMMQVM